MINRKIQAATLLNGGYHIVPINAGEKGPFIKGWQNKEFTEEHITAGIGVKCGVGDAPVCAVDIDVTDKELADKISEVYQSVAGATIERIGQAPKTMLIYQADAEGWTKAASRWFSDSEWRQDDKGKWITAGTKQRIEILGKGQQFVALAVHPGTNEPYQWVDMVGGIEAVPASALPVIDKQTATDFIAEAERLATKYGMYLKPNTQSTLPAATPRDPDNFLAGIKNKVGLSLKEAKKLLNNIDASDYDTWVKVGMALHHEFDGDTGAALALYDDWSQSADNYGGFDDVNKRWLSFATNPGRGVTARSLIKWGKEANAEEERRLKLAILEDYLSDIDTSADIFTLTDDILPRTGKQLDIGDVVTIKTVRDAASKKAKELGYPLTVKEIDTKLGVKKDRSQDALEKTSACTEFGNALRMLNDHKDTIMFVSEMEAWYVWDSTYWRRASQAEIERLAKQTLNGLVSDFDSLGLMSSEELFDFIKSSLKASMVSNMVRLVRSEDGVMVGVEELDSNKLLFGAGNGTIDLTTGELLPADPYDRITIATGVPYSPRAKCDVFIQTLNDVFFNDQEMVSFFQRLIGYTMLGNPVEDIIVIPFGSGSNGKSTVLGAIRDVFDEHAKTAANETFLGSQFGNSGGPREDILRLMGSRFVYVSEPDENGVLKEGLVKSMTGGEAMPARAAYAKATIEVLPTWVTFMPTNHKPIIRGDDHGIWRRILPIPFERNFDTDPDVTKDKHRADKLLLEKSGILKWCVDGALEYQRIGLAIPDKIKQARDEYKADMDLLSDWLDERCTIGPREWAGSTELWKSWEQYSAERGELRFIPNARSLGKRLSSKGFKSFKNKYGYRGRGFTGLSIKASVEPSDFDSV